MQLEFEYEIDQGGQRDPRGLSLMDMVKEFRITTGQKFTRGLGKRLIYEEYIEWDVASVIGAGDEELKELADLVYVVYGYSLGMGWDLDEAVRRVHENNMGRMYQPDGTILRRKDGKIMKNKAYPAVELGDLV